MMELSDLGQVFAQQLLGQAHRPLRLRLAGRNAMLDDVLLLQRIDIRETLCGGISAHLTCLASRADLPLKSFLALPVEVQLVTDRGQLRRICAIVTHARKGQSDGSLSTFQLTAVDALAVMQRRRNSRVFQGQTAPDIASVILDEWRRAVPTLASAFRYVSALTRTYPRREFVRQDNESDAAFLRRLFRRSGIAWFFRPAAVGDDDTPAHELVLFDDAMELAQNAAGQVRFHRADATEERATIELWAPARELVAGAVARSSWDYKAAAVHRASESTIVEQGDMGRELAAFLQDAVIEVPHAGDDWADHDRLTRLAMQHHEFNAKRVHGAGCVADMAVGEWNEFSGQAELDARSAEERQYIAIEIHHLGTSNLPKALDERAQALLAASEHAVSDWMPDARRGDAQRYANRFTLVRRDTPIVPAWEPREHLPPAHPITAVVVGPPGEAVWCDALGRVKVQFIGLDPADHEHAQGAGTSGSERDSAWLRWSTPWAGARMGLDAVPRVGMEVVIGFLHGDCDRPYIAGCVHNRANPPVDFSAVGSLPANKLQSGLKSQEIGGSGYSQLRLDDTHGQTSVQTACDHLRSQITQGHVMTPRRNGAAQARGEGIEALTQGALAARGERGVLLSAEPLPGAESPMLQRPALIGLAEVLQGIQRQLADLAATHQAGATDSAKIAQIVGQLKDWENGSDTAPGAAGGGKPMVALSAPSGIALGSGDNLLLGAQTHIDAVSAGNTQLSAGRHLLLRCGELLSAFAHGAMKLIAQGKVELQSHADNIELTGRRIVLNAEEVLIQAPVVRFVAQGAQVDLGGGQITQQSTGAHVVKSASFAQMGPGGAAPPGVKLPASSLKTDERFVLYNRQNGEPIANRRYRSTLDDGQVVEARTDAQGRTSLTQADAFRQVELIVFPPDR